jgi:Lon protease-like protein
VITSPIPLFPLGLVLLPGAVVPLHIFEPRYRDMLRDVTAGASCFGLITVPDGVAESELPAGRIGCMARVSAVQTLPDGRSNIVIEGEERFRFETYLEAGTPYRLGHVAPFEDLTDDDASLANAGDVVRTLATRIISASMTVQDVGGEPPVLDSDNTTLAYQVAALLHLSDDALYGLLAARSPLARLTQLETALRDGVDAVEAAAERHMRGKSNGHLHDPPPD